MKMRTMIGKTISHYQLLEKLEEGGMGMVYKIHDMPVDHFAAIKGLRAKKVADPERAQRFFQETYFNHPNTVTIRDSAQEGGTEIIVTEYVEYKTLEHRIGHQGLGFNDALRCVGQGGMTPMPFAGC